MRIYHGMTGTPEWKIWCEMRRRCNSPNRARWNRYGGRGISVCDSWESDFRAFLRDMGPRPSTEHSIDRIDNDGNYSPENCQWATHKEQSRNTSRTRRVVHYKSRRITLPEAAEITGIPRETLRDRLKRGWPQDRLLDPPISKHRRKTNEN